MIKSEPSIKDILKDSMFLKVLTYHIIQKYYFLQLFILKQTSNTINPAEGAVVNKNNVKIICFSGDLFRTLLIALKPF